MHTKYKGKTAVTTLTTIIAIIIAIAIATTVNRKASETFNTMNNTFKSVIL